MERRAARPWKYQGLTGRRKGTSWYCLVCQTWHPTHRGIGDPRCPSEGLVDKLVAPAYIPLERLRRPQPIRMRIPFRVEG
jgi:hypothetical protein